MFAPQPADLVQFPAHTRPQLVVIVDAEEEFEWSTLSATATSVRTMRCQDPTQRLLRRYRLVPTYAIDFPVASQADGFLPLRDYLADGACEIGAQLHPWVNPPFEEVVCPHNSFAGNLPRLLEREKLVRLTRAIEDNLAVKPILYKAGRYGAGVHTAGIVTGLGYRIDSSVMPHTDFTHEGGPNYLSCPAVPYWIPPSRRLFELPTTVGLTGLLAGFGMGLSPGVFSQRGHRFRVPGMLARLNLLERIRLSPEGFTIAEAIRLSRALVARGRRVFVLSYHSPSLEPGCTPYVRTAADRRVFLAWLERYFDFFFSELGGVPATPASVRTQALDLAQAEPMAPAA